MICPACFGLGQVPDPDGGMIPCPTEGCHGGTRHCCEPDYMPDMARRVAIVKTSPSYSTEEKRHIPVTLPAEPWRKPKRVPTYMETIRAQHEALDALKDGGEDAD